MQALTPEQAYRRAGGRRRYNADRQARREWRRACLLIALLRPYGYFFPPEQVVHWAEEHGVSTHTIYRDLRALNVWERRARRVALFLAAEARQGKRR